MGLRLRIEPNWVTCRPAPKKPKQAILGGTLIQEESLSAEKRLHMRPDNFTHEFGHLVTPGLIF